jgi:predicted DCC family thiol-disulfide oxidoreductase YuxK
MYQLIIFYDGKCPLCANEMRHLARLDKNQVLEFFDIHNPKLLMQHPDINFTDANNILHGKLATGETLKGLDVTYKAWSLVGKGYFIAPLRWFWLKPIADKVYLWFAKNRFTVSRWVTGKPRCADNCQLPLGQNKKVNDESR